MSAAPRPLRVLRTSGEGAGGGSYCVRPLVFSEDNKQWFGCAGNDVVAGATATGAITRRFVGHTDAVTAITFHNDNPLQLLTAGLDGTVRLWDSTDGMCLRQFEVGAPIVRAVSAPPSHGAGALYAVVVKSGDPAWGLGNEGATVCAAPTRAALVPDAKTTWEVVRITVGSSVCKASDADDDAAGDSDGSDSDSDSDAVNAAAARRTTLADSGPLEPDLTDLLSAAGPCMGLAVVGRWVVALAKRSLLLWDSSSVEQHVHRHSKPMSCLAVHPNEEFVVTGDAEGQLHHWHCLQPAGEPHPASVTITTHHWHSTFPSCLAFSPSGDYLVSGGEEGVMVLWQLGSGARTFLPRLGAPIRSVAVSRVSAAHPMLYAVGLRSNTVLAIDAASLSRRWSLKGLALCAAPPAARTLRGPLVMHPRTGAVLFNTSDNTGSLQLYEPLSGTHVGSVDVLGRNFVVRMQVNERRGGSGTGAGARTGARAGAGGVVASSTVPPPKPAVVTQAAFSSDGKHLVTVDTSTPMSSVKFWGATAEVSVFSLNTQVDEPHKAPISILRVHPKQALAMTASADHTFKMWDYVQTATAPASDGAVRAPRYMWNCRSVGVYRSYPITAADFSGDGSLLAVAYSHIITLWQPLTNLLVRTLTCTAPELSIKQLAFPGPSPHLVACTDRHLMVWDLLSCEVSWTAPMKVSCVAGASDASVFAVTTTSAPAPAVSAGAGAGASAKKSKKRGAGSASTAGAVPPCSVAVFDPTSPQPISVWTSATSAPVRLGFLKHVPGTSFPDLVCLTHLHTVLCLRAPAMDGAVADDEAAAAAAAGGAAPGVDAISAKGKRGGLPAAVLGVAPSAAPAAPSSRKRVRTAGGSPHAGMSTEQLTRSQAVFGDVPTHTLGDVSQLMASLMPQLLPARAGDAAEPEVGPPRDTGAGAAAAAGAAAGAAGAAAAAAATNGVSAGTAAGDAGQFKALFGEGFFN